MLRELMNYLDNSRSAFNGVDNLKKELLENEYTELKEFDEYKLKKGGKYFVARNNTSLIAFKVPANTDNISLHIASSHSDCPSFKIKPNALIVNDNGVRLNTEPYGGLLLNTWLDKPLGIAGRVMVLEEDGLKEEIFDSKETFCLIPSVAPHLTRGKDAIEKLNPQVDMLPLAGLNKEFSLEKYLSDKLNVNKEKIMSFDLYLYPFIKAELWGSDKEILSSHHLDNLESAFISFKAFLKAENENNLNVFAVFDNEEVGSLTRQGADSDFLANTLKRVCAALDLDYYRLTAKGMLLSIDNGHAIHPNHPELSDINNHPKLNDGVVIKVNARQSYCSDSLSIALFKKLCDENSVKYQVFANRSDSPGGSTLGNISNGKVSLISIDIGLACLGMHSSYETVGANDVEEMYKACIAFYKSHLNINERGYYSL